MPRCVIWFFFHFASFDFFSLTKQHSITWMMCVIGFEFERKKVLHFFCSKSLNQKTRSRKSIIFCVPNKKTYRLIMIKIVKITNEKKEEGIKSSHVSWCSVALRLPPFFHANKMPSEARDESRLELERVKRIRYGNVCVTLDAGMRTLHTHTTKCRKNGNKSVRNDANRYKRGAPFCSSAMRLPNKRRLIVINAKWYFFLVVCRRMRLSSGRSQVGLKVFGSNFFLPSFIYREKNDRLGWSSFFSIDFFLPRSLIDFFSFVTFNTFLNMIFFLVAYTIKRITRSKLRIKQ